MVTDFLKCIIPEEYSAVGTVGGSREMTEGRRDGCSGDRGWR